MTQVVFVYSDWITRYPEFTNTVNSGQGADLFAQATFFVDNSDGSVVQDIPTRTFLLYLVTAHLAQIDYGSSLQANNALPGAIDSATEGSVSVTTKLPEQGSDSWWNVTKYGRKWLRSTVRYSAFQYVPGRQLRFNRFCR